MQKSKKSYYKLKQVGISTDQIRISIRIYTNIFENSDIKSNSLTDIQGYPIYI